MALALEGVDLVALACVFILIGMLLAVKYTFTRLASVLDVNIPVINVRPFAGVSGAIESYVIAGCNDGIGALEKTATTLWHWSTVALTDMADGLTWFIDHVGKSTAWLVEHGIPNAIHAVTDAIERTATDAHRLALDAGNAVKAEAADRVRAIDHATATIEAWARTQLGTLQRTIEGEALHAFPQVERDVHALVADAVTTIEHTSTLTASTLAGAAEQALRNAQTAEGALAGEIRDLLGKLNPVDVAALIASIPLIKAAVDALEADTGLGNAECRTKVKGICATDPGRWLHFLEGLAFTFAWPGLEAFAQDVADGMNEVVDAISELVNA